MNGLPTVHCPVTAAQDWELVRDYTAPPSGETDFGFRPYRRMLLQSRSTGHFVNHHDFDIDAIYEGDYWDRTYGGGRIRTLFDRIMALSPESSDNRQRVAWIRQALARRDGGAEPEDRTLLDVGSGLAVFPAVMKAEGWCVTALDPDPRSAAHAEEAAGVRGLAGDFMAVDPERKYSLISFNKVLEHVRDPVAMLRRSAAFLSENGCVYVELPDGEAAVRDSPEREEFFVEHWYAFSAISYAMLSQRAGFRLEMLARVIEPSGKYTLRGLMSPWERG